MSHVARIDLEINDLEALAVAAKQLGLEFVRGQETYRWYGRSVGDYALPVGFKAGDLGKCQHVLRIPGSAGAFEIGITKRRDGGQGYCLLWDFWNGGRAWGASGPGMQEKVGENGERLKQEYAAAVATKHALKQGYRVFRTVKEDGRILLRATK